MIALRYYTILFLFPIADLANYSTRFSLCFLCLFIVVERIDDVSNSGDHFYNYPLILLLFYYIGVNLNWLYNYDDIYEDNIIWLNYLKHN